jgi:hypothetical protein
VSYCEASDPIQRLRISLNETVLASQERLYSVELVMCVKRRCLIFRKIRYYGKS